MKWPPGAKVRVHALANAPVAASPAHFPVVLLLAGNGALVTFYSALAEDLASHGYIVVGPEAAYRTSVVVLANGTVLYRPPENDPGDLPKPQAIALATRLVSMRSTDIGFVLDQLARLDTDPRGRFAGRLDLRHIGVVGHSLGGAIVAAFCRTDHRCQAGVDIDGRLFGSVITRGLHKPFMFMFEAALSKSNYPRIFAQVHSMYADLPADSRLGLSVAGANHFSFTDQMLLKNPILLRLMCFGGAIGGLSGRQGLQITEDYVRTFLDVYLKGLPEHNLRSLAGKYPRVRVWTH